MTRSIRCISSLLVDTVFPSWFVLSERRAETGTLDVTVTTRPHSLQVAPRVAVAVASRCCRSGNQRP
jgi:hypothetical protein